MTSSEIPFSPTTVLQVNSSKFQPAKRAGVLLDFAESLPLDLFFWILLCRLLRVHLDSQWRSSFLLLVVDRLPRRRFHVYRFV